MEEKIFYYHSKPTVNLNLDDGSINVFPRFTVAGEFKDADLILAISLCSERDHFIKKLGRIRSSGRLKSQGKGKVRVPGLYVKDRTAKDFVKEVIHLTQGKTKKQLIKDFGL
jgi:hypothetical protein